MKNSKIKLGASLLTFVLVTIMISCAFSVTVVGKTFAEFVESASQATGEVYEDSAIVDFSEYNSIEELGSQFYWSSNVTIEDGVLVIPKGETFGWVDMNDTFIDFFATNGSYTDGFNIELKTRTSTQENWLVRAVCDDGTVNKIINLRNNSIIIGGNAASAHKISTVGNGKFTDVVATFCLQDNRPMYFVDGAMIGQVISSTGSTVTGKSIVAFEIASGTEVAELYIHRNLKSKLAASSGNVYTVDPDIVASNISSYAPTNGMSLGTFTDKNVVTDANGSKYFSINYETANQTVIATDIPITDYLEDRVTVFEMQVKFTPAAAATAKNKAVTMLQIIRREADGTQLIETLLDITALGKLSTPYGVLCDKDGKDIVLSSENWQNIAVIYDADAGQISYHVGGDVAYYHKDGEKIPAECVQLSNSRYYRMESVRTQLRTAYFPKNSLGKLELEYVSIYSIDESANVEFIGTQTSESARDIRIVAGLDMLHYGSAGFNIVAYDSNGELLSKAENYFSTSNVYSSISEMVDGEKVSVYPEDYGYRYFLVAQITGVTSEKPVRFEITPYTAIMGKMNKSSAVIVDVDFTEENMAKWVVNSEYVSIKPKGDNINANFSTTEYVSYTNDGALELNGLDAEFAFCADCEGQVSLNLTNSFGEVATVSSFDVYVDNLLTKSNVKLDFGHHSLVLAENLAKGVHTFKLVKKSGGDFVRINSMNFCGEIADAPLLVRENAVDVVVSSPASGNEYGDVFVYVQTSEKSGDYYIKYNFKYKNNPFNSDLEYNSVLDGANTRGNISMYRVEIATLVKKNANGSYSNVFNVLSDGEISLAMQENYGGVVASDFVGGWHGDEHIKNVEFYLNGVKIDTTKAGSYVGTQFEMLQDTVVNRCNTPSVDVMNHSQKYLVNTNGIKLEQQVEFLTSDYQPREGYSYLQMGTFFRINSALKSSGADIETLESAENLVCRKTNLLDANGNVIYTFDCVEDRPNTPDWTDVGEGTANRYAEYIGNDVGEYKGVYGLIGFVIDDASVISDLEYLKIRSGDNKWYASFDTPSGKDIVPKGEVWNVSNSYFIDYNPEFYGNVEDDDKPDDEYDIEFDESQVEGTRNYAFNYTFDNVTSLDSEAAEGFKLTYNKSYPFELVAGADGYIRNTNKDGHIMIEDTEGALNGKSFIVEAEITFTSLPVSKDNGQYPIRVLRWIRAGEDQGKAYNHIDDAFRIDADGKVYFNSTTVPTDFVLKENEKYTIKAYYTKDGQLKLLINGDEVGTKKFLTHETINASHICFMDVEKATFDVNIHSFRAYYSDMSQFLPDATRSLSEAVSKVTYDTVYFQAYTDKDALSYAVNETINMEVYLMANGEVVSVPYFYYTIEGEDGKEKTEAYVDGSKGHFGVTTSMANEGHALVTAYMCDENKNIINAGIVFRGGAIVGVTDITSGAAVPEDLEEYWDKVVAECYADEIINLLRFEELSPEDYSQDSSIYKLYLFEIDYDDTDKVATGYISYPVGKDSLGIRMRFRGYGATGVATPQFSENEVYIDMAPHGFRMDDPDPDYPDANYGFDPIENQNPDTVYFHEMFTRNLLGARFLKAFAGGEAYGKIMLNGEQIQPLGVWEKGDYFLASGGSQGGFQAMAVG